MVSDQKASTGGSSSNRRTYRWCPSSWSPSACLAVPGRPPGQRGHRTPSGPRSWPHPSGTQSPGFHRAHPASIPAGPGGRTRPRSRSPGVSGLPIFRAGDLGGPSATHHSDSKPIAVLARASVGPASSCALAAPSRAIVRTAPGSAQMSAYRRCSGSSTDITAAVTASLSSL